MSAGALPRIDPMAAPRGRVAEVRGLEVYLSIHGSRVQVIKGVDFHVDAGETLCLLGESGSGKSLSMRSLIKLLPRDVDVRGSIKIEGRDVNRLDRTQLRMLRGGLVSMIFQDPGSALDPTFTIGAQIVEAIRAHEPVSHKQARARALDLLELVQIPEARRRLKSYPSELSGGLRQRAMIGLALSCHPKLLLADEPTTALDATVQSQIIALLKKIQVEFGMSIIFVTHDVGVACEVADRIGVMYAGRIVETGSVRQVVGSPAHPYTKGLLASSATRETRGERLKSIPGAPPDPANPPAGCSFAPRCSSAQAECRDGMPEAVHLPNGQEARCLFAGALAACARPRAEGEGTDP